MKQVLFVILDQFSDWESAPLAAAINRKDDFCVKTVSLRKEPVLSIGGFSVNPDYNIIEACAVDFAGIVLVGGNSWRTKEARQVEKLVHTAVKKKTVVAAICGATVFLGTMGMLNDIDHTSNELQDLKDTAGDQYTGAGRYQMRQAVRCGKFVTANGTANMEFAKEVLIALSVMSEKEAEQWYRIYKYGYYEAMKSGITFGA